jgi:rhodanese-related sulfurtransferase
MRLAKKDFDHLLKEPLVQWVTMDEAKSMAQAGAGLLDVRLEDEHRNGSVKGSINMPLYLLRMKLSSLDAKRKYVVFCQTGSRSCSAAFILSQRGFDVYVLRGGLNGIARAA